MKLIGKKVKGFKFEDGCYKLCYRDIMDDYIGRVGVIISYNEFYNSYTVYFEKDWWMYPAELIEQHLVSDEPLDSLPMLGEGVLCKVWDDSEHISNKRFICAKTINGYVAWNGAESKEHINYEEVTYWKNARQIEIKKHTMAELEKILGYKFEIK